jgi:hypothetical protein
MRAYIWHAGCFTPGEVLLSLANDPPREEISRSRSFIVGIGLGIVRVLRFDRELQRLFCRTHREDFAPETHIHKPSVTAIAA